MHSTTRAASLICSILSVCQHLDAVYFLSGIILQVERPGNDARTAGGGVAILDKNQERAVGLLPWGLYSKLERQLDTGNLFRFQTEGDS